MDAALAELRVSNAPNIAAAARRHGVDRSSLSRRFRKKTTSRADKVESDRLLNNQQEQQLISWIRRQCELCLPPTPRIVCNFAAQLAGRQPQKNWCSRFVKRHKDSLDSRYLNTLDLARHKADSREATVSTLRLLAIR